MILKIVISSLLVLSAANAVAGNMYIYKDQGGQVLLTNVNTSKVDDKLKKKVEVKVTYYRDTKIIDSNPKQTGSKEQNASYGTSSSGSYANSAYAALK